ncbi:glucosamine-6-phosphate deaminase [Acidipropionibacterium virtanenii]|uniref:Glucosamine-6-phosphate deaminase n=1 Tax=Acidipropionibacterium virtanenii TaxID=2057246 RepID=A0A344UWA2_9ACTN|nr:glucosamine-6-phosphate deaminase [Acidipropionibacterium virtanenii]AXE39550.1 Glucosamine-6-phosphate deaminase [Acidipropionibacterium virtanenii]
MEVIICQDAGEAGRRAARRIAAVLSRTDEPVLGVATGSTPLPTYRALAELVDAGDLDTSRVTAFALDEYVGMPVDDERSYADTIRRTVTEPLGLDPASVHVPDGMAENLVAGCQAYEDAIREAGGVDVQILGIGGNGHIGFNEPTSSFASRTRLKTLAPRTRQDNKRYFAEGERVPTHCVTQGLGTIMDARHVLLLANGEKKAEAVAAAVEGPVSSMCPASVLQHHPHAVVILDEAAASRLRLADYYRYIWDNKPEEYLEF